MSLPLGTDEQETAEIDTLPATLLKKKIISSLTKRIVYEILS